MLSIFIINLSNNHSLIIHLGMSGKLYITSNFITRAKHDHVIFYVGKGRYLVFNDARRFGMVTMGDSNQIVQQFFSKLGVEPLTSLFDTKYLKTKISSLSRSIKNILMDNEIVVGIGNIYSNEAVFLAKINPYKLGNTLTDNEINNLVDAINLS